MFPVVYNRAVRHLDAVRDFCEANSDFELVLDEASGWVTVRAVHRSSGFRQMVQISNCLRQDERHVRNKLLALAKKIDDMKTTPSKANW